METICVTENKLFWGRVVVEEGGKVVLRRVGKEKGERGSFLTCLLQVHRVCHVGFVVFLYSRHISPRAKNYSVTCFPVSWSNGQQEERHPNWRCALNTWPHKDGVPRLTLSHPECRLLSQDKQAGSVIECNCESVCVVVIGEP